MSERASDAGSLRSGVLRGLGMSDTPEFEELVTRLRALLDSEYRRGRADAARRIIEAAEAQVSPSSAPREHSREPTGMNGAVHHSMPPRRRAPHGSPDALVTRVLLDRGPQGASSTEIEAAAVSEAEKMVSQSGIRFALDRGRSAGRYRNERGLWFLVEERKD
jgi:hypothetical protein